jgi:uncharacterized small protein (DUF1192 family)
MAGNSREGNGRVLREAAEIQPVTGITKKYKGVGPRMATLRAEMKVLRAEWARKVRAKAAARS